MERCHHCQNEIQTYGSHQAGISCASRAKQPGIFYQEPARTQKTVHECFAIAQRASISAFERHASGTAVAHTLLPTSAFLCEPIIIFSPTIAARLQCIWYSCATRCHPHRQRRWRGRAAMQQPASGARRLLLVRGAAASAAPSWPVPLPPLRMR